MWCSTATPWAASWGGWEDDSVGGFDGAAAVDEFGVDAAVFGGADGQAEVLSGFAVVGGVGVVADEDSVADGDAVFGEDSGERGDGRCVGFGLPGLQWVRCRGRRRCWWRWCRW